MDRSEILELWRIFRYLTSAGTQAVHPTLAHPEMGVLRSGRIHDCRKRLLEKLERRRDYSAKGTKVTYDLCDEHTDQEENSNKPNDVARGFWRKNSRKHEVAGF